ncbi:MAG: tRNA uridine-5-carboxymethylaminomethyl(34) synthesis enzyme MnmG [Candidatus Aminicenantes bacterium]|nr:tRNA uridine-5-carboxymethylaminomethyl(34) synthesis enzyme MnmG [Candidatus Aminicenantes bacterium]MBL7082255.1 tRNA uridine-5-carboxymethylaminomethyl(34) synthesis enzyme MnmG [Candidatus Aminicenantes bacterium]
MKSVDEYDVIVVGAGHAGCEAAYVTSTMGLKTCLITIHLETIAQMSCNPAIGGLAKGHLVREIDALGGLMGLLADKTGLQFRLLNRSRGGAVQAPRAQSDKVLYRLTMKNWLENIPKLTLFQGFVTEIFIKDKKTRGVLTLEGNKFLSKAVILTPGTFLNGLIHIGLNSYSAGRANEPASKELAENLKKIGLKTFRLKTGTPMRLDKHTIDWSQFTPQAGDKKPVPFSFRTQKKLNNKILCHIGYTNQKTHEIIKNNLDKSPLFSGKITGIGPRYCPSIEDKVVKFPHHLRHQFFLEPEGLETAEIYVNGISSSLPLQVQKKILQSIPGLDQAKIFRPAYGIEYDAVVPTQLRLTLETKNIKNLYLAGQINGTSGYEEAAAQGLMAGINAALKIKKRKPFILRRDQAYIAVLIDDLISKGVEEPYRLFTSRAEYRLLLRIDNADKRLTQYGYDLGLIKEKDYENYLKKQENIKKTMEFLKKEKIITENNEKIPLKNMLKKPEVRFKNVVEYKKFKLPLSDEEIRNIESEVKYEGYLKKQEKEIARIKRVDKEKIPKNTEFKKIAGLTGEVIEKLEKTRPQTIGEAKKIPGITPAATINLHIHLKIQKRKKQIREKCST